MIALEFRDRLEEYITKDNNEEDMLEKICLKVHYYYCCGNSNLYKIKKIMDAYNDFFDYVMSKFDGENETILHDVKRYIMGCDIDYERNEIIKNKMKCWALFFDNVGIEPTLLGKLINRYKDEFVIRYSNENKKQISSIIYVEYLLFVKKLSIATQVEQIKIMEELKAKDVNFFQLFSEYLLTVFSENAFINRAINISDKYLEKLMDEEFLLVTTKELVDIFLKKERYIDYEEDIKRIYMIQKEIDIWIDINKLNNFISENKLALLKKSYLIEEAKKADNHLIKLTELGFSLETNKLIKVWESDMYLYESESEVLLPFTSNPVLISKYLFNKKFTLKERDFLIVFDKIETDE